MPESVQSILAGTIVLQAALAAALALAIRTSVRASIQVPARVALLLQTLHFAEEWRSGFPERFAEMAGFAPWPAWFFPAFNVAWIVVWAAAVLDQRLRYPSRVALWFLAIASVVNGAAHPLLALRAGAYFPGLYTAPLVGLAGLWLAASLWSRRRA